MTELLTRMIRMRVVEEGIAKRYAEQKMRCPTHLSIGQEAVAAAAGMALRTLDYVVSTHRGHAHYLGKQGDLKAMLAEIYGKEKGCSRGRGGSMHLVDLSVGFIGSTAIVANSIPIGVGLGLSCKLDGEERISCIFLGDGAVEEGVFYESLNFAAVRQLPVLFICENNLYSVYSPLHVRQPKGRRIFKMVEAIGVQAMEADGNDAVAVFNLIKATVSKVRSGGGPQFFEFSTYRWYEHCGPNYDNDLGYRTEKEFLDWKKRDPIKLLISQLLNEDRINEKQVLSIYASIEEEVEKAFSYAESEKFPEVLEASIDEYYTEASKSI